MNRKKGCGQVILGTLFVIVACLVFAAFAGAMVRTGEIPLFAPRLTAFQPDPNYAFLPTTPITFTFDQPMNTESVEAALLLASADPGAPSETVPGTFRWNQDRTQVVFTPSEAGFAPGTTYTVRLAAGVKAGTVPRTTARALEWNLSMPPLLHAAAPPLGEQEVDAWPLLEASFNYALDCEATLATFSISPETVGALHCDGHSVTFDPTLPLAPGTAYAAELGHIYLKGDDWPRPGVSWEFRTAPPLTIVDATPVDGAILTNLWTPIRITLSRPVVAESFLERFQLTTEDGQSIPGTVNWEENDSVFVFEPTVPFAPEARYLYALEAGVGDELGFELAEGLERTFDTEPMLGQVTPPDRTSNVHLDETIRISFLQPMDRASVEAGLTFTPDLEGDINWEENTLILVPRGGLAPETKYEVAVSGDVRDATGAPLVDSYAWSFTTQRFLLRVSPTPGATLRELQTPFGFTFALPMDRSSVESAIAVSPSSAGRFEWSEGDTAVAFYPEPAWQSGTEYEVILSGAAHTADGVQNLGQEYVLSFSTNPVQVQFGEGPNVQVMDASGERVFQFVVQGADYADFRLYAITPTQFLDLYSSGFRGIGPQEPQLLDTSGLTPTAEWREAFTAMEGGNFGRDWQPAEAHIPTDVPAGLYLLTPSPPEGIGLSLVEEGTEGEPTPGLLIVLTRHGLVLKRALAGSGSLSQAQLVAWDTELTGGAPVISATLRLYDRDGSFLAEGVTDADGLLSLDVPGDPGPLLALSDSGGDVTVCGLSNEWSESGWWWWWTQPTSRPLYTIYSYTDRPIYRPAQTLFFKNLIRADADVSYTLPSPDLPITVRLRDARDNVAATQVLTPTEFGTIHGEFQLADEPMLGTWNLETEVEGTTTRQALKVEEYRKPEYEVVVRTPEETYVQGETIDVMVDAVYYFGQPVADATVELLVYPTYSDHYFGSDESQFGYPIFSETGRTDAQGQWSMPIPTEELFHEGSRAGRAALALEATVTDDSGQAVSSYQTVVVQRTSRGLTLLLDRHGFQPGEAIDFSAQVRDRHGEPTAGIELTASVRGWDEREVAGGTEVTDDRGYAHFSVNLIEQGWYGIEVLGTDDNGREIQAVDYVWVYDPTGRAPWYQGGWAAEQLLTVSTDRTTYAVGDEAQIMIYSPASGPALMSFERGETHHAQPIALLSGTNMITIPIRADFAPNIHIAISQFGPLSPEWWGVQSLPEGELHKASTQIWVPMPDRVLTVTLTADQETYAPGDEATFRVQVTDQQGHPVVAEVSLAVVDEAIYALAEDMSKDPFEAFYGPRSNLVRTFDSLRPTRWLFPEGPGLGGGGEEEGGAPRRDFLDTAYWAPTIVTDESGQATITFELPDNLTEWRALARAVTTDTLVGQATTNVVVSQDIVVRPALPRFLVQGDALTLTAVIHNFTGGDASATAKLDLLGLTLTGDAEQTVQVPAGGSAIASWPVLAEEAGEAQIRVQVTAAFGARQVGQDAVELPLTVHPLAIPEVSASAGTLSPNQPTSTITITLPSDAIEGLSRLEINLAPSIAPGLLQGLEYLIDYPFG